VIGQENATQRRKTKIVCMKIMKLADVFQVSNSGKAYNLYPSAQEASRHHKGYSLKKS
jgi:hypothetical protein